MIICDNLKKEKTQRATEEKLDSAHEGVGQTIIDFYYQLGYYGYEPSGDGKAIFFRNIESGREYAYHGYFKYDWYGEHVTPEFLGKVIDVTEAIGVQPDDLMMIMASESGISTERSPYHGQAVGLIQFTNEAASAIGTTLEELEKMTAIEQLYYVGEYYKKSGKIGEMKNVVDIYVVNAAPSSLGKAVVYEKGSQGYSGNSDLDFDNDGKITRDELEKHLEKRMVEYLSNKPENHKRLIPIKTIKNNSGG